MSGNKKKNNLQARRISINMGMFDSVKFKIKCSECGNVIDELRKSLTIDDYIKEEEKFEKFVKV
jgi:hypothetical protein